MKQLRANSSGTLQNVETNTSGPLIGTHYCGKTKSGRIKLQRENLVLYGIGGLYEVISSRLVQGKRKVKTSAIPTRLTSDYKTQSGKDEQRIACVGRRSGREFRFVGRIVSRRSRSNPIQKDSKVVSISNVVRAEEALARKKNLLEELQVISRARNMGLDPGLKLKQMCALLQESRSSVYRKIKMGIFPQQIKRGKGSFWLLSQIEEYSAGKWRSVSK